MSMATAKIGFEKIIFTEQGIDDKKKEYCAEEMKETMDANLNATTTAEKVCVTHQMKETMEIHLPVPARQASRARGDCPHPDPEESSSRLHPGSLGLL